MALNLHLLRLFAAVANQASFSRAAETLHISQPAVSKGVRELEQQIGQALLERGPGAVGVSPTPAGAVLLEHARALFAVERAAEDDLVALRGLGRGRLEVGASTTVATWKLPPILGAFHTAHPAIALRLVIGNTRHVADAFRARELDIALVEGPVEAGPLVVETWMEDELVCVCAPRAAPPAAGRGAPQAPGHDTLPAAGHHILPAAGHHILPAAGHHTLPAAGHHMLPAAGQDTLPAAGQDTMPAAGQDTMPAAGRDTLRRALAGMILVAREPGSGTRDAALEALRSAGIGWASLLEIGSTEAIREVVAGGIGFAVLGRATVADAVALGRLAILDVFDRPARRTLSRLRLPGRRPSAAAAAFDLLLDAQARDLARGASNPT